jgi:hypothetical protein
MKTRFITLCLFLLLSLMGSTFLSAQLSCTGFTTATFNFTGAAQTWVVPAGVTSIRIKTQGASGGLASLTANTAGGGAVIEGEYVVTPGSTITILVGGRGTDGDNESGGGGSTGIYIGATLYIVAGGGGGEDNTGNGGVGVTANNGTNGLPINAATACPTDHVNNSKGGTGGAGGFAGEFCAANNNGGGGGGGFTSAGGGKAGNYGGGGQGSITGVAGGVAGTGGAAGGWGWSGGGGADDRESGGGGGYSGGGGAGESGNPGGGGSFLLAGFTNSFTANGTGTTTAADGTVTICYGSPPVTTNITNPTLFNTFAATDINDLSATDDGTITSYTIETLPAVAQGVLTYFNGIVYVAVTAGQVLTAAGAASLRFDPAPAFTGNASFTFSATDNTALKSNISTFTIPVEPLVSPTTNNITAPVENNSYGQTIIPALSGAIASGTIASYTVQTIPPAIQGVLYLCNPVCAPVIAGQVIIEADKDKLKFDPAAGFTGNATFTYFAFSSAGVTGNTATYTIPVNNEPPFANTILAQVLTNTAGSTSIPSLSGSDPDGTVSNYTIATLPPAVQGVLYLCNPACAAVTAGQSISAADAANLQFDPAAGFIGTARFNYTATDNNGNVSPAAAYNIPVKGGPNINLAPYSDNIVAPPMTNSNGPTLIPGLSGHDADGTIASYTIETIPPAAQGILTYCSNSTEPCTGIVTPLANGTSLTPAQMATLKFDPAAGFKGTADFTYSSTDNSGNKSNNASYTIPVVNVPPVANPITTPAMSNTFGQTAIPALSGHDPNTITNYTITTIPAIASGILYLCNPACNPVIAGQVILPADIAKLRFDPAPGFTGNAVFTYTATDNNGDVSQTAPYIIPVINTNLSANLPPVADNKTSASMPNTNGQTAISSLSGTDPDGTVSSFTINSLPAASQGVLYLCSPACTPVTAGQVITVANAANLQFDPAAGFEGNSVFDYTAKDNAGKTSNVATFTIPVTSTPPRSINVQTTPLAVSNGQTAISGLSGTDADGSVISYTITGLPPANTGVLFLCNPACNPVTPGQVILAADAANLQFDPAGGFTGIYSQFNYLATDNSGKLSNTATFTIPLFVGNPLPVTLLTFTGENQGAIVNLHWITVDEINFSRYVVERSTDGISFADMATLPAKGESRNDYHTTDDISTVNTSVVYYRLRMVDIDGRYKYSPVVIIRLNSNLKNSVNISPNPVTDKINARISSDKAINADIRIIDALGQVIYRQNERLVKGENIVIINQLRYLSKSVYTLQVVMGSEIFSAKFINAR